MSSETIVCTCAELTRNWSAEDRAAMCGHHKDCPLFSTNFLHVTGVPREEAHRLLSEAQARATAAEAKLLLAEATLSKINDIRNSIIGFQAMNWSEHVYPLVAALEAAGVKGMEYDEARENVGTLIERATMAESKLLIAVEGLKELAAKPLWGVEERVAGILKAIELVNPR